MVHLKTQLLLSNDLRKLCEDVLRGEIAQFRQCFASTPNFTTIQLCDVTLGPYGKDAAANLKTYTRSREKSRTCATFSERKQFCYITECKFPWFKDPRELCIDVIYILQNCVRTYLSHNVNEIMVKIIPFYVCSKHDFCEHNLDSYSLLMYILF